MSSQEDIAAMQIRIAKAESERDNWRVSGMQEKYLEAYSMVEALELQLERLRQAARVEVPGLRT
jgi:predicted RNase H-like nuclease (RuvC/YqgF family)